MRIDCRIRLTTPLLLILAFSHSFAGEDYGALMERDQRYSNQPSPAALQAVHAIGRTGDRDGIRELLRLRDARLFSEACSTLRELPWTALPSDIESMIIRNYADPDLRRFMRCFIARNLDREGRRIPAYQTRELFDQLLAELKAAPRNDQYGLTINLVATDVEGVEAELLALAPGLDVPSRDEIVGFLGRRRYAPAVPTLKRLQADTAFANDTNGFLANVNRAYVRIGTPEAMDALFERLRWLRSQEDARARREVWPVLLAFGERPSDEPLDFERLRAALPNEMTSEEKGALAKLIQDRKEKRGIPDLIAMLSMADARPAEALLAIGAPDDWRRSIVELDRLAKAGEIQAERAAALRKRFDEALAAPDVHHAKLNKAARRKAFEQALREYGRAREQVTSQRAGDAVSYVAAYTAWVERGEALLRDYQDLRDARNLDRQLIRSYGQLADVTRFRLKQPDAALGLYRKMMAKQETLGMELDLFPLVLADVARFDRGDHKAALSEYRKASAALAAVGGSGGQPIHAELLRRWIENEIRFVESGTRFSGVLTREDVNAARLWLFLVGGLLHIESDPAVDRVLTELGESAPSVPLQPAVAISRALAALPASQFQLVRAARSLHLLPADEVLRFLGKHDPAGYLSAGILAASLQPSDSDADEQREIPGLIFSAHASAAAQRFFRERGIHADLAVTPDARFASPEQTWGTFIASARRGDANGMLACFMPDMASDLEQLFRAMSPEELKQMADSFVAFAPGEGGGRFREAMTVRLVDGQRRAGFVHFVSIEGEWKIESM
jgi:uncharacterized protein with PIN domain